MNLIAHEELPLVCAKCLGPRAQSRLTRDSAGSECRLCAKPYPSFRWKVSALQLTRQTTICAACARKLNACQSCVLDLEFRISLKLRDAALRIMEEEGGSAENAPAVLAAVREAFLGCNETSASSARQHRAQTLEETVRAFPLAAARPPDCRTLCVYGIEEDLAEDALRSFFHASIERVDYVPAGRYAFFEFTSDEDLPDLGDGFSAVLDGRRLQFAWGERVPVPRGMQRAVGAVVRAYLRQTAPNS